MAHYRAAHSDTSRSEAIISSEALAARRPSSDPVRSAQADRSAFVFRAPVPEDGPRVTALIAACPPLDTNSAYCNLLQCSHFADTCVVAERGGQVLGWISAYRPPSEPDCLFVWQVAVDASARGERLGRRMIEALLDRPSAAGATTLITTVTEANAASWGMFEGFARAHGLSITRTPKFEREAHFAGAHDTEWQASIGPLAAAKARHPNHQSEEKTPR